MDFSGTTILCLGDIMLDRFSYCGIERISPEAPVPVLQLQRVETMLGGAGNVARNIAALGGKAVLLGLLGGDPAGDEIRAAIRVTAGLVDAHVASAARPTVCKTATSPGTSRSCLLPDVLMKGADWTVDTVVGREEVEAAGGRVALIDLVEGHSTTHTIGRMQTSATAEA